MNKIIMLLMVACAPFSMIGQVGIGTTSPSEALDLETGTGTTGIVK